MRSLTREGRELSSIEVVSVIGARPQFIKAAVVSRALAAVGITEQIVHTGQHYDDAMSGRFLSELGIVVAANLAAGSGDHARQTARMMVSFQEFIEARPRLPDAVIVYGDTNSTIAAGLVAAKLGIALVHIEAGLRSYNRAMPEEINRVVVDHLSDLLFCSSPVGLANLAKEGVRTHVQDVGDVMLDAFQVFGEDAKDRDETRALLVGIDGPFVLATVHRPSNTDDPRHLGAIVDAFGHLESPVLWPVHPRNRQALEAITIPATLHCIAPVGYLDMLGLLGACAAVITDSGGLQKEAHWAQRPCITLRSETEWVETLEGAWNVLSDPRTDDLAALLQRPQTTSWQMLYGDGRASQRIANGIREFIETAA